MGSFFDDDDDLDALLAEIPLEDVVRSKSKSATPPVNPFKQPANPSSFSDSVSYKTWTPRQSTNQPNNPVDSQVTASVDKPNYSSTCQANYQPVIANVSQPLHQPVNRPSNSSSSQSNHRTNKAFQDSSASAITQSRFPTTSPQNYQSSIQNESKEQTSPGNSLSGDQPSSQAYYDRPSRFSEFDEKSGDEDFDSFDETNIQSNNRTIDYASKLSNSRPVDNSAFSTKYLWTRWKLLKMSQETNEILYIILKREIDTFSGALPPSQATRQSHHRTTNQRDSHPSTQTDVQAEDNLRNIFGVFARFIQRAKLPGATTELLSERHQPLDDSIISADLLHYLASTALNTATYLVDEHRVEWAMKLSFAAYVLFLYSPIASNALPYVRSSASLCVACLYELAARQTHDERLQHAERMTAVCASVIAVIGTNDLTYFDIMSVQAHMLETKAKLELDEQQKKRKRRRITTNNDEFFAGLTSRLSICLTTRRTTNFYHQLIAFALWLRLDSIAAVILESYMENHTVIGHEHRLYRILIDNEKCYHHCARLIDNGGAWLKSIKYDADREQIFLFQDAWNRGVTLWHTNDLDMAMKLLEISFLMAELIADWKELSGETNTSLSVSREKVDAVKNELQKSRRTRADADAKRMLEEAEEENEQEEHDLDEDSFDEDSKKTHDSDSEEDTDQMSE